MAGGARGGRTAAEQHLSDVTGPCAQRQSAPVDLPRAAGDCVGWRVLSLRVWYPVDQPRSRWGWIKEELRGGQR